MVASKTTKQRAWCGFCAVATPLSVGLLLGSAGSLSYKGTAGSSLDRCTFSPTDTAYVYPGQPSALDTPAHSALFEDVCIHGGTESPKEFQPAVPQRDRTYVCACCGEPLFAGESKFDSKTGWPSFSAPIGPGAIGYARDGAFTSTEVHATATAAAHTWAIGLQPPSHMDMDMVVAGALRPLRSAPGSRLHGRSPADRPPLLHRWRVPAQGGGSARLR